MQSQELRFQQVLLLSGCEQYLSPAKIDADKCLLPFFIDLRKLPPRSLR